jgi:hypothetical protein
MAESRLKTFCDTRVPRHVRHEVRLGFNVRGDHIDLYEERPAWDDPSRWTQRRIAQIRYEPEESTWRIFSRDRHNKLHDYHIFAATKDFDEVLAELNRDRTGIFWG